MSRLQVFARVEDADGKSISVKSTADGKVVRMGREVYEIYFSDFPFSFVISTNFLLLK